MLTIDSASIGAKLYSLSADTLLIMRRVEQGYSDAEILKWSARWRFSTRRIHVAFREVYTVFELGHEPDVRVMRTEVSEVYRLCRRLGLTRAPRTTHKRSYNVKAKKKSKH